MSTRLTGRKFDTCITTALVVGREPLRAARGSGRRWYTPQSRKFGITWISRWMPSVAIVSR